MTSLAAPAVSHQTLLILAALLGIGTVVVLITWLKAHPFLALILGSAVLGLVAGVGPTKTINSFTAGVGSTVGSIGLLVALGAMIGGLLMDSGGVDRILDTLVRRVSPGALPWALAGAAALIGIPLFFEVGVVLLVPIVLLLAGHTRVPLVRIGIPALAGLSVLHGFVPPHPGPLAAITSLKADVGLTLALGLLVAAPAVVIAGPVYGTFISRYVTATPRAQPSQNAARGGESGGGNATGTGGGAPRRPAFVPTVLTVLLPVILMLARAIGELKLDRTSTVRSVLDILGNPVVALLAGTIVAMFTLGVATGMSRRSIADSVGGSLPPIAGILLIVAAGGGFKQTLVDAGVGDVIADAAKDAHLSVLLLGWLVAVGIRLATGSATVSTIAAAGITAPLAAGLDRPGVALLVLAIGAGSLFFSHVNDAGFWLVKEYFGMTVGETIKTWSIMETIISVIGLLGVLLLNLVV